MDISDYQNKFIRFSWTKEEITSVFRFQFENNPVYRSWCMFMGNQGETPDGLASVPFMPVEIFKCQKVISGTWDPQSGLVFASSTTSSGIPSLHYVRCPEMYHASIFHSFLHFFGHPKEYVFIGILPGYLERMNASLVYMVNYLIKTSGNTEGRIFSDAVEASRYIGKLPHEKKIFVIGVSYAMMDLAQIKAEYGQREIIWTETGGMKGKREEKTKPELLGFLKSRFSSGEVCSEYGMTEMLSQAWKREKDAMYKSLPWLKFLVRDITDPKSEVRERGRGQLLVADMANIFSCCFLATQDVVEISDEGMMVLGRTDFSEIRGCNLMYETK